MEKEQARGAGKEVNKDVKEDIRVLSQTPRNEGLPLMDWDKALVGWDSPSDPGNPLNWPKWKKRLTMIWICTASTLSPMTSPMVAPAISQTMRDFNETNNVIGSFMVTIYLLGFSLGPLFIGPFSEMLGRYPVMVLAAWFLNLWLLGCALAPNITALIIMRLLAGVGGSAAMTVAPAICADMFPVERRARSTAIITLAQCLGPSFAPLIGSFVSEYLGWRWDYWFLLICTGTATAGMTLSMPESYAPVLLQKKAERLRKETGRSDLRPLVTKTISRKELLLTSIVRPTKLLTCSPIVFPVCLYVATIYGFLYLWFTTIPSVFEDNYGWSPQLIGLPYIGVGVGMFPCLAIIMNTNDATIIRMTKLNNGVYEPEFRLPATSYFAPFVPISLIWYGWTVEKQTHYIIPMIGMSLFGCGMLGIFVPTQQHLVDAFDLYSASAVAAVRTSLSLAGCFLPLAGPPLYKSLGVGWGNTILGCIAVLMTPISWLFMRYGKTIRQRWPVTL